MVRAHPGSFPDFPFPSSLSRTATAGPLVESHYQISVKAFSDVYGNGTLPHIRDWGTRRPRASLFTGCAGSADALLITELYHATKSTVLALAPDTKRAEILARECASLVGRDQVLPFPSRDPIPYNMKSPFGPTVEARLRALAQLINGESRIYIAPAAALLQKTLPPQEFYNRTIRLAVGDEVPQEKLARWLEENGFRRETLVQDVGTYAARGGVFDIYPFVTEDPFRLEFWGDSIDSIRSFDVFSQKSKNSCARVELLPMKEFPLTEDSMTRGLAAMEHSCEDNPSQSLEKMKHRCESLGDLEGMEWFLHWFDLPAATIFDYLPPECTVVWDDILPLSGRLNETVHNYVHHISRVPDTLRSLVSSPERLLWPIQAVEQQITTFHLVYVDTANLPENTKVYRLDMRDQPHLPPRADALSAEIESKQSEGYEVHIVCENSGQAERLSELLGDTSTMVTISVALLQRGFIDPVNKRSVLSANQFWGRGPQHFRTRKIKAGVPISSFDSLTTGDFVVHVDHGISRFTGLERIQTDGVSRDCMALRFRKGTKLYVPVDDFHKVHKYVGKDSVQPTLSTIGSGAWEKVKQRARESTRKMAQDLLKLYAEREHLRGISYSKDNVWQKEFEDAFMYEATPDQIRAIEETKHDMISARPMDRLVCGDVGFGKTEIAMRAAFKAVLDGYQVAILAPTTILAAQHHATFTERMADFPVNVASLSRFLTPGEQRAVLKRVAAGEIDILVGTHRILSKDIRFKNLGLLVVDEEQRFGVRHKEVLKQYRYDVDVLSMTATPIPRTLHMSLVGIRDLSIVNTPPRNRLPIETHVCEFHEEILRTAVEDELDRGGQVYVVHNRISGLAFLQERIEQMVPRARVAVAHGQMDERMLESVMREFVAGRYDVLVSTAIVESGLDIPNVNTIIVDRADALGLSQLYQLRGRVGRSSEQAFAYLLTPPFCRIKDLSLRRLRALEQYTDLGSGFQIAMRDMEIRGAGNLLGTHQHGFIAAVGFELYCRLLKEEVCRVRGEALPEPDIDTVVDFQVDALLPASYVSDGPTRVSLYQECASCASPKEIDEMERTLADRFGSLPEEALALLGLMRIKVAARAVGIARVSLSGNTLSLTCHASAGELTQRLKPLILGASSRFRIINDSPVMVKMELCADSPHARIMECNSILLDISFQATAA